MFFAEVLIHSLVKSSRIVFCDCLENEKLTRLPSYLVESVTTEKRSSALGPLHQEQTLPIDSYVGGLRCFKSRKPEDRLGCHRLLEIACGACIGH